LFEHRRKEITMLKRYLLCLVAIATVGLSQVGCAPLAAGVAGAAIGHEVAEREDKKDGDRD
jgi:hypothetical protein